jgi:chromate transporter
MYTPSSILVYIVGQRWQRLHERPWRIRLENGLIPVTIGLVFASGWVIAQEAGHDYIAYLITAVTAILVARTQINPLLIMVMAGIVSALLQA